MKRVLQVIAALTRPLLALGGLLLLGMAAAQDMLPTVDPSRLGADVGALAATVLFIVQFLKRQFERQGRALPWWRTLLMTVAVAEGLAALLFYAGYGARFGSTPPPLTWIIFGLVAAAISAGVKDLLSALAERGRSTTVVTPTTVVQPGPLPGNALPGELAPADILPAADPSRLPGFQPATVEQVMQACGPIEVPGLDTGRPL